MDLSDNDLTSLENLPLLKTLQSLLLSNNRIQSIAPGLGKYLPKLNTVILANNRLGTLEALEPLGDIPSITDLWLLFVIFHGPLYTYMYCLALSATLAHVMKVIASIVFIFCRVSKFWILPRLNLRSHMFLLSSTHSGSDLLVSLGTKRIREGIWQSSGAQSREGNGCQGAGGEISWCSYSRAKK
jgi:Leucine-rich repeat (LRR) protein